MRDCLNVVKDYFIAESFIKIDNQIICEKLQSDVLKKVAKQLYSLKSEQTENIKKDKEEHEKSDHRWYSGLDKSAHKLFKEIFVDDWNGKQVKWAEIDDSCMTIYQPDELTTKIKKELREIISDNKSGCIITQDIDTNKYEYLITNFVAIKLYGTTKSNASTYDHAGHKAGRYTGSRTNRWKGYTTKEKLDLCEGKRLYCFDFTGKVDELYKTRKERLDARAGMISLDPFVVAKMAEANKERYKNIISKLKVQNDNIDSLLDNCTSLINKITQLAVETAKDPISNADLIYPINKLNEYVYNKKYYQSNNRGIGRYVGNDGLLPLIHKYTNARQQVLLNKHNNNINSMYKTDMDDAKKCIQDVLNNIKSLAQKYSIDLDI